MATYVPGTLESDPKKLVMSLQQVGPKLDGAVSDIATNTADIAALQASAATFVVGPASATNNGFAVYDGTTGKLIKNHAATIALGSEVSGTLPVANGGTGDTGTAWAAYTPTIDAAGGAFTTVSGTGRYKQIGKTTFFTVTIIITTNGTASSWVRATLPATAANANFSLSARDDTAGIELHARIAASSTRADIFKTDGTYPGADGKTLFLSGVYEAA
jgi:hypothetical protein